MDPWSQRLNESLDRLHEVQVALTSSVRELAAEYRQDWEKRLDDHERRIAALEGRLR
jgi:hypothetical protein